MRLLSIYLFLLGWTGAFALHAFIPIPMIIGIVIFLLVITLFIQNGEPKGIDKKVLFTFIALIFLLFLSFAFRTFTEGLNYTALSHLIAFSGVILTYFFGVYYFMQYSQYPMEKVYKYLSWGVIFVSLLTLFEYLARNTLGIEFDFLRISRENIATYSTGGERVLRTRGTTIESGHLAMYLLIFLPFVYYYYYHIKNSRNKMIISIGIISLAVFSTFSAAGFAEIIIILLILMVLLIRKILRGGITFSRIFAIIFVLFISILGAVYYFMIRRDDLSFLYGIFDKITLTDYSVDDDGSRLSRWYRTWNLFLEQPIIGHGPGITSIEFDMGSTNMYLEILAQTGIVGFLVFAFILIYHLAKIIKLNGVIKFVYIISFTVMIIHMGIVSDYWYPWIWTVLVMINVEHYRQKMILNGPNIL